MIRSHSRRVYSLSRCIHAQISSMTLRNYELYDRPFISYIIKLTVLLPLYSLFNNFCYVQIYLDIELLNLNIYIEHFFILTALTKRKEIVISSTKYVVGNRWVYYIVIRLYILFCIGIKLSTFIKLLKNISK